MPLCPSCKNPILPSYFFCPNCGKALQKRPLATSVGKQIEVYLVSVFLPPFGLVPGFKYLFQPDGKSKVVGVVCLVLSVASIWLTVYYTIVFFHSANQTINQQLSLPTLNGY